MGMSPEVLLGAAIGYLDLDISGFKKGMEQADSGLKRFIDKSNNADSRLAGLSSTLGGVGAKLTTGFTFPLAAAGAASTKFAADFDTQLAKISTVADNSILSTKKVSDGVLKMSKDVNVSASELANGLYEVISATNDSASALSYLEQASKLAKGGFTTVNMAVDAGTSVMNAYGESGKEAFEKISDIMIQTQNVGKTTVDEMASHLSQVIPTAAAMSVSFEQVGASLASITAQGTPTAQATTLLNSMFSELGKQGQEASKNLIKAAEGTKYADMTFQQMMKSGASVTDILKLLKTYADKSGKSLIDMFGSIEAGKSALSLTANEGAKFNEALKAIDNSAGSTQKAFETMNKSAGEQFKALLNQLKTTAIQIGTLLLPVMLKLAQILLDMINKFNSLSDSTKKFILVISGILFAIGPVSSAISSLINIIQLVAPAFGIAKTGIMSFTAACMANPIILVVTALVALATAVAKVAWDMTSGARLAKQYSDELADIKRNSSSIILQTQNEIDVIKTKGEIYEKLRVKYEQTGQGLSQLQQAEKDLQSVLPESIGLIDAQTGAYLALGNQLDFVIQKMTMQAQISAYSKQIEDATTQAMEMEKKLEGLKDKQAEITDNPWKRGLTDWLTLPLGKTSVDDDIKATEDALANLDKLTKEAQGKMKSTMEDMSGAVKDNQITGDDIVAPGMPTEVSNKLSQTTQIAKQEAEQQTEDVSEEFKRQWQLRKDYHDLGQLSDVQYYNQCERLLKQYNTNSNWAYVEYAKEIYQGRKSLSDKLTDEQKSNNEKLLQEQKAANEKMVQEMTQAQEKEFGKWSSGMEGLVSEAQSAFDRIGNESESLQQRLANMGSLVTEKTLDDGTIDKSLTSIDDAIKKIDQFAEAKKTLESAGASSNFMSMFTGLDIDKALEFMDELKQTGSMSNYLSKWEELQEKSKAVSDDTYATQLEKVKAEFTDKFANQFAQLPQQLQLVGNDTIQGFIEGIISKSEGATGESANLMNAVIAQCKTVLDIHSPSRVLKDMGVNTVQGFIDGEEETKQSALDAFFNLGTSIMSSFLQGLQSSYSGVITWLKSALSDVSNMMNAEFSYSGASGNNAAKGNNAKSGDTYNQYIYGNEAPSPLEVFRNTQSLLSLKG